MICHTINEIKAHHKSGDFIWKPGYSSRNGSGITEYPLYGQIIFEESNPESDIIFKEHHLEYNPETNQDEIQIKEYTLKDQPYLSIADTFPEVQLLYLNQIQHHIRKLNEELKYYNDLSFLIQNYKEDTFRIITDTTENA